MKIFAVADLHLSGEPPFKPMDIFGEHWQGHWDKIKRYWCKHVTAHDIVLLPGDISWAMKLDEALPDLNAIIALPGRKIMVRGNHDYWWSTLTKMSKAVNEQITFLQNNFAAAGEFAVCGSRGWNCPGDTSFSEQDLPIYLRELNRVRTSLHAARAAGYTRLILMLHYPPVNSQHQASGFSELMAEYRVEICVYGHLHGKWAHAAAPVGTIGGTFCHLVACDALNFTLKQIV